MKFFTKLVIGLIIFLIIVIIIYAFTLKQVKYDFILVQDGDIVPEEACAKIENEILVIIKTGCPACAKIEPILKEIENEKNLEFKYINVAIDEQRDELMKLGFVPSGVPAVIINCKNYEGALSKERYLELLKFKDIKAY